MDPAVTLEIIGLCKGLATLVALEWAYTSVDKLMPGEGVSVSKCLSTSVTLESLLLTVRPHVRQQWRLQCKGSPTDLA